MIWKDRRLPVVTCPKCEQPFKMTRKIIASAVADVWSRPITAADNSTERSPAAYRCPLCGEKSTHAELCGEDVEPFDATTEPDAQNILPP